MLNMTNFVNTVIEVISKKFNSRDVNISENGLCVNHINIMTCLDLSNMWLAADSSLADPECRETLESLVISYLNKTLK